MCLISAYKFAVPAELMSRVRSQAVPVVSATSGDGQKPQRGTRSHKLTGDKRYIGILESSFLLTKLAGFHFEHGPQVIEKGGKLAGMRERSELRFS
jgi:hypothetical protein